MECASFPGQDRDIEIVDHHSGGWGHIDIDQIEFADKPRTARVLGSLREQADFGSMSLGLLDARAGDWASAAVPAGALPGSIFGDRGVAADAACTKQFPERPMGALARVLSLEPGAQATATFVVAWHFPNILHLGLKGTQGRQYGTRFASARAVIEYVAANYPRLSQQTRLWHDTWYDSTLPYWFLDRTLLNVSTLATSTAYWLGNDRFYGWEGVGCCHGTCQHVWHYAQAVGRLFPSLERATREMVDYGLAFHDDTEPWTSAPSSTRAWRSTAKRARFSASIASTKCRPTTRFCVRLWSRVRKSLEYLMVQDLNQDGMLAGSQMNTLDAAWFGKIAWLSSLYVAAVHAGAQMALEMGDEEFAKQARSLAEAGGRSIDQQLFNGEYFIQVPDPAHRDAVGSYDGCEIDQVFGQSWAFQVGLGRVLPRDHTLSALRSLWKYNFTPDVGRPSQGPPARPLVRYGRRGRPDYGYVAPRR